MQKFNKNRIMSDTAVKTKLKRKILISLQKEGIPKVRERKRIPVDEIYWGKGMYMELVPDPFRHEK